MHRSRRLALAAVLAGAAVVARAASPNTVYRGRTPTPAAQHAAQRATALLARTVGRSPDSVLWCRPGRLRVVCRNAPVDLRKRVQGDVYFSDNLPRRNVAQALATLVWVEELRSQPLDTVSVVLRRTESRVVGWREDQVEEHVVRPATPRRAGREPEDLTWVGSPERACGSAA